MKIAIVGTHGIGKTTLCFKLASHYKSIGKNVKVIQEVARCCPFPINEGMTKQSALWIYYEHAKKELEAERNHDVVVCDRSIIDSFIYADYFKLDDEYTKLIQLGAFSLLHLYSLIIYVKPDIPIEADGVRAIDLKFQEEIDKGFKKLFKKFPFATVKSSQIFDKEESWKQFCLYQLC